jgi:hypothetical protein
MAVTIIKLLKLPEKLKEIPEKNEYSHISDALQYGLAGGGEYHEIKKNKQAISDLRTQHVQGKWEL